MRHQWINELGPIEPGPIQPNTNRRQAHDSRQTPEDRTEPSVGPLLFGFALLFAAICFYLSGLWLPATLCCVVGGIWMGSLLDKDGQ